MNDFKKFLKTLEESEAAKQAQQGATNLVEQIKDLPNTTPLEIQDIDRLRENTEITRNKFMDYFADNKQEMQEEMPEQKNYVEMPQKQDVNVPVVPESQDDLVEDINSLVQSRETGEESQQTDPMRSLLDQYRNISARTNQADQLRDIFNQYQERVAGMRGDFKEAQGRREEAIQGLKEAQRKDQIMSALSTIAGGLTRAAAGSMGQASGVVSQPGQVGVKTDFAGAAEQDVKLAQQDLNQIQKQIDRMDITPYQKAQLTYMAENADTKAELDALGMEIRAVEKEQDRDLARERLEKTLAKREKIAEIAAEGRRDQQVLRALLEKDKEKRKREEKEFEKVRKIRKDVQEAGGKKLAEFYDNVKRTRQLFEDFVKNPDGFGDTALLLQGVKNLQGDLSVVRAPEMDAAKNAINFLGKIANQADSFLYGKQLQPEQRQQILNAITKMENITEKTYLDKASPIINQVKEEGLPVDQVLSPELRSTYDSWIREKELNELKKLRKKQREQ